MSGIKLLNLPADRVDGEAVAALFFEDERPVLGPAALLDWRLNGLLTNMIIEGQAQGRAGEHLLVRNNGKVAADWILFMGGGNRKGLGREACQGLFRHFLQTCCDAGFSRVTLCLDSMAGLDKPEIEEMLVGMLKAMGDHGPDCRLAIFDRDAGFRR